MEAFEAAGRLHGVHDWAAAAEQYSAALSVFEREPAGQEKILAACHDRRGACLAALERHDEAVESHSAALELCPDAASAWHNRGEALMLRGSLAEAQSDLEQALRLQDTEQTARMLQHVRLEIACPPEAACAFTQALECYGRHEHEEAKALFVEARELGHTRPGRCHNGEGICYTSATASRADLEAAVACFDAAIEAEPENPKPWHNRGTAKARLGRGEEADHDAMAATTLTHAFRRGGHTGSGSAGGAAAALHGGDDESLPSYSPRATLEGLKMSALMERARALGAPGDAVDECMDAPDPRASLIAMLEAWEGAAEEEEEGELLGEGGLREKARRLVGALAAAGPQTDGGTVVAAIHHMLALCSSSATDTETEADTDQDSHSDDSHSREEKPAGPLSPGKVVERVLAPSVAQILAAAGAVEVTATVLMQVIPAGDTPREASEGGVDERPPVLQSATLLLSTIAAKHDAHAFFSGCGAIGALVAALDHGLHQLLPPHPVTHTLLPPAERGGDGAVEPLAASALANLAFHDGLVEGASTAAAKEILAAGAVGPLVDALSRAHLRTQQWAAAALCNLSMHGERARQTLAEGGAVEAIAAAISRLSLHAPLPGGDDEDSQPQGRLSVKVRAVATSEARGSSGWIRFMEVISRRPAPHCEVGLLLESGLRKVSYRTTQSATVRSSAQTEAMGAEGGAAPPGTEGRAVHLCWGPGGAGEEVSFRARPEVFGGSSARSVRVDCVGIGVGEVDLRGSPPVTRKWATQQWLELADEQGRHAASLNLELKWSPPTAPTTQAAKNSAADQQSPEQKALAEAEAQAEIFEEMVAAKEAEGAAARSIVLELLLGAINNLAPHRPDAVVDSGGLEAALSVLEHAPTHTPRGGNISAAQEAASALIVGTAEASSRPSSAQPLGSPSRSFLGDSFSSIATPQQPSFGSAATRPMSAQPVSSPSTLGSSGTRLQYSRPHSAAPGSPSATERLAAETTGGLESMLADARLLSLPARLTDLAAKRPGSATVKQLITHVETLFPTPEGPLESTEEREEREAREAAEEAALMRQLAEEEDAARQAEEEEIERKAVEEAARMQAELEEELRLAAGLPYGAFSDTLYQKRYRATVVIQRRWRRRAEDREAIRLAAEERAARIEARNVAAREKAKEERAARLQAQREQREAEIAAQDALLAMDVSTVEDGATLSSIVGQRAKARADLAPYRWGDLNKFASKRTLGRAERAANEELARVVAMLNAEQDVW